MNIPRTLGALLVTLALATPLRAQPVGQIQGITVVDSGTACVTAPTACATFALDSQTGSLSLNISGTWTGTLTFEGSNNGGVWTTVSVSNLASGAAGTTTTANGLFSVTNAGLISVRARATAAITGTAVVTAAKGLGAAGASVAGGGGSGLTNTELRATPVPISGTVTASGGATAAKQPALGTAGAASADVITVQGIASGTPLLARLTDGTLSNVLDPCASNAKVYFSISQATSTQLVTGTSAKKLYICHVFAAGADAENISLVAGTGSVCGTNTVAVVGGTTAANGPNLAANSGFSIGNGASAVAATTVNADNLCLLQSGSGRVAGSLAYVVQ